MEFSLLSEGIPDLLPMQGRSPGFHLSDIVRDICIKKGLLDPKFESNPSQMQLGCALEWALSNRYAVHEPGRFTQPGEVIHHGIPVTGDLVDLGTPGILTPHEIKLTWMSSDLTPRSQKFWKYMAQVMFQADAYETDIGITQICHVNGDYTNMSPIHRIWELKFTKAEMREHRALMIRWKKKMEREREKG